MSNESKEIKTSDSLINLLQNAPDNQVIIDNLTKAYNRINSAIYSKVLCAISGGADSDVLLDICFRCDRDNKVDYIWYDTGLEYQATKDHLKHLEEKYNITIKKIKAIKPIPLSCKEYGQPFVSKLVSDYLYRLQRHNFQWEDDDFDTLYKKYPKCKSALAWWCNINLTDSFNIKRNKFLKEFIIANPPTFKISSKCCEYAKKNVAKKALTDGQYDLNVLGIRKYEGGLRSVAYKSCFDSGSDGYDNFRPLFWYTNQDRLDQELHYNVLHSKCYSNYGLQRTGCAGCPFARDFESELEIIKKFEPNLYIAVNNIFGDSQDYTRKYRAFRRQKEFEIQQKVK